MKAILIDDERHVRKLLTKVVDWNSAGIDTLLEADDGEEAVRLIEQERPEIIITDMRMPKKDGVSLLQWIQEHPYPHKTIVISGYNEFKYLRQTIQSGGYDYLIKPIDEKKVSEVVCAAASEWKLEELERQKNRETEMKVNEVNPLYWNHLLTQLVEQPGYSLQIQHKLEDELQIFKGQTRCRIVMIECPLESETLQRKFRGRTDLFYFSIMNITNEILDFPRGGIAFRLLSKEGRMIMLLKESGEEGVMRCRSIYSAILSTYGIEVEFHLGYPFLFPDGLEDSLESAQQSLVQLNLLEIKLENVYIAEHIEPIQSRLLIDDKSELRISLQGDNPTVIRSYVESLISSYTLSGILQRKQIHIWENELDLLKEQLVNQKQETPTKLKACHDNGRFSLDQLKASILKELNQLARQLSIERGGNYKIVHDVHLYIDEHYMKPLTVQYLAEKFYLNSEYLSRQYKQEYGNYLKDYITETRIRKAKVLLGNPQLRINEIAEMVGFQDEKYFSKVFKKATLTSPKDYRKER